MANTDSSSYTLRWNEVLADLEFSNGLNWYPTGLSSAGLGINQLTGDVTAGPGLGSQSATVVSVGGASAANVATAVTTANNALPKSGGTMTGAITEQKAAVLNVSVLATTGTVTPDGTLGPTYTMGVTGAVTLNGPSSPVNGQKVTFIILNDGSHSVTLATGAGNFRFGTDITAYTNSVSKTDYLGAIYNGAASRWDVVALIQGF